MSAEIESRAWHGPGCTVVVSEPEDLDASKPLLVDHRVTDVPPAADGTPRTLVIAVTCSARAEQGTSPETGASCHFAIALDREPPSQPHVRWATIGDVATAWDAVLALRGGDLEAELATGIAVAMDGDALGSMPLESSALRASIGTPWFAWSNGSLACAIASGTDAGESFWDFTVVRNAGIGLGWRVAFRAMAYVAAERVTSDSLKLEPPASRLNLAALASTSEARTADRSQADDSHLGVRSSEDDKLGLTPRGYEEASPNPENLNEPERRTDANQRGPLEHPNLATRAMSPVFAAIDSVDSAIQRSAIGGDRLSWVLFWSGLLVYILTRLLGIADYPLAFDGDEAGIVVLGRALRESGFRDGFGIWFPIFFAYPNWNPDVGVYVHLASSSLFGVSVTVARTTSALLTIPAPVALAAALKWGFGSRGWWLAPYVLSALPIWFHLSRSAYDSATWVSFFACAVAAYFRYRFRDPSWALQFVAASLLTFYSNAVAHLFAVLLGVVVMLVDWRYHVANWRAWRVPLALALAGLVPLLTFLAKNPGYLVQRLSSTHPHWGDGSRALLETISAQSRAGAIALNPMVWFVAENRGRYVDVTGYHNYYPGTLPLLPWWVGVLVAVGLIAVWLPAFRGRRTLLLALLAMSIAPTAISRFAPTRSLAAVVPVVLLSITWADAVLPRGSRVAFVAGAIAIVVATTSSLLTLGQALTSQSTRVQDFGGYGIQWGSKEVFALVNQRLRATPGARVMVTTDWTWGGHHFIKFFIGKQDLAAGRVFLGSLETILKSREPWGPELWAILSPSQLEYLTERMRVSASEGTGSRVVEVSVTDAIAHPDGSPGFVMVRMREAASVAAILAAERAASIRPTYSDLTVDGAPARVGTTAIDDGFVEPVLNHAPNALVRFSGPNPTIVDVTYTTTRPISSIRLVLGAGMWKVTARLSGKGASSVLAVTGIGEQDGPNSIVNLVVGNSPFETQRIVYEILQPNASEDDSTVHLYSVEVRP